MAFVTPFLPARLRGVPRTAAPRLPAGAARMSATPPPSNNDNPPRRRPRRSNPNNNNNNNSNVNNNNGDPSATQRFAPFDGSRPMLPAYRPPTLEAAFSHNARRVVHRARHAEPAPRLVRLARPGHATLYARVVQDDVIAPRAGGGQAGSGGGEEGAPRVWLRPLLLDLERADGGFLDLRGGANDLVLPAALVADVGGELRTRVEVNLAATEPDVVGCAIDDGAEARMAASRAALMEFVREVMSEGGRGKRDDE